LVACIHFHWATENLQMGRHVQALPRGCNGRGSRLSLGVGFK
jgi:hypothetical protein